MTDEEKRLEPELKFSEIDQQKPSLNLSLQVPKGVRVKITIEAQSNDAEMDRVTGRESTLLLENSAVQDETVYTIDVPIHHKDRTRVIGFPLFQRLFTALQRFTHTIYDSFQHLLGAWRFSLAETLFGVSILFYLLIRLVGLTSYPVYFFSDEAIQTNLAADFIRDNFTNYDGEFFPTYFYNVDKYSLSISVYLQTIPYLIFGKSDYATRATSVLVTLLAAIYIGLILRDIFKFDHWWVGTLLLSMTPAWFLHSRTAFETVIMVSFYTAGLYYYLLYRYRAPRYLYSALILFALSFYSYNPGQIVVGVSGLIFFLIDIPYHWKQRYTLLAGLGLFVLLALPYIRFRIAHPDAIEDHLYKLASYWIKPISLHEKLSIFWNEYKLGLSPGYWFIPNTQDLSRHLMKGYSHLSRITFPIAIFGSLIALKNIRESKYRVVLGALLAAPTGAALVNMAITRALVMVVPATLLISIGLIYLIKWFESRQWRINPKFYSLFLFVLLVSGNLSLFFDALRNGPTWYCNYGLGGMQFGARQVFTAVEDYLHEHSAAKVTVSPAWANSTDVLANFYLLPPNPIQLGNLDDYLYNLKPIEDQRVFVIPAEEFEKATSSGKFTRVQVEKIIPYPNEEPGFFFVRLDYVENIEEILEEEKKARRELQTERVIIHGEPVQVRYSLLDMGKIEDLWDGDAKSVTRTYEANPYVIEITFPESKIVSGVDLVIGDTDANINLQLFTDSEATTDLPLEISTERSGTVKKPLVSVDFQDSYEVEKMIIALTDLKQNEPAHVHLWELVLR